MKNSRMIYRILGCAVFALSALTSACVADPDDTHDRVVTAELSDKAAGTHDQRLVLYVSQKVPEFAGLYVEGDVLIAATVGEVDETALWTAIEAVLPLDPGLRRTVRDDANHSFSELVRWHDQVDAAVFGLEELVFTDVDERTQKLVLGLSTADAVGRARTLALRIGLPEDALDVVLTDPVQPLAHVREKLRPLLGGTQIAFSNYLCTLGFNTRLTGQDGFVTNSHCTDVRGAVTGTKYGQPNKGDGVGTELFDPFYWAGGMCNVPNGCRYSDSAFIKTTTAGSQKIALPDEGSLNFQAHGRIASKEIWPLPGTSATKVGRTTGRTEGVITNGCANIKSSDGYLLLCNYYVASDHTLALGGDSGSPVFRVINDPEPHDVNLMGVLWGGSKNTFVFSPLGGVEMELGTMKVCAPEIGC